MDGSVSRILGRRADRFGQPGLGEPPVPADRGDGYVQRFADLLEVEAPDHPHLDQVSLPRAQGFELLQRVGELLDLDGRGAMLAGGDLLFVEDQCDA